jgi:hypothetical protein
MRSTDAGATWTKSDDSYYDSVADFAESVAVGPDGRVYLALLGNGVIIGTPGG